MSHINHTECISRSIRSTSVPKMFMNSADDMLARSTVETWVIKAEKGEQARFDTIYRLCFKTVWNIRIILLNQI